MKSKRLLISFLYVYINFELKIEFPSPFLRIPYLMGGYG